MKLGVRPDTYDCFGEKKYQKMKEHGFSCAAYVMVNTDQSIYRCTEKEFVKVLRQEKKLAEEAEIEITQLHGPFRIPPKDLEESDRQERMEKMIRSIQAAALLGCRYWVIHPLMPYGIADKEIKKEEATRNINIEFMKELLITAKKYDVVICLENMPYQSFSLAHPKEVDRFVRSMADEHFKMCLDTGHAFALPDGNPAEMMRRYGENIKVLHVHDNNGRMDQHLIPYFGQIDWKDFYKALQEVGFKGDFSLETEPSRRLPLPLYEEMCRFMAKVACAICS